MPVTLPTTTRTRVKRLSSRANYDQAAIFAVLDEALYATVAFHDGQQVHAIPMVMWREQQHLYIHGSCGSRLLNCLQAGAATCVSVTRLDGMVLARSAMKHSLNYHSVCLYGTFETVPDVEKVERFRYFFDHWLPGRWQHVRAPDEQEIKAVAMLRMPIVEAVLKARQGPPNDLDTDMAWPVWAGVAPLHTQWGTLQHASDQQDARLPGQDVRQFKELLG